MKYDDETFQSLKDDLKIDRDALDTESIEQPSRFFHASEGHVFAISRRDHQKQKLEIEIAELDKDVRDAMVAEGEKITEMQVKHQITREQDYQRAYSVYLNACLEADKWEALKNAYRQRADMLKGLIQLHQSGYFGEVTGAAERKDSRSAFNAKRGI